MDTRPASDELMARLCLTNSQVGAISFFLEPWGEEYTMPTDATFEIVATGPRGGTLDVEIADDRITVWGWAGSTVALSSGGTPLGGEERTPVPLLAEHAEQIASGSGSRSAS